MNRLTHILPPLALIAAACGGGGGGGAPEIVSFSVDKMDISAGESVTLTWETKNGSAISIGSMPVGVVMMSGLQASGTFLTSILDQTTTFKLIVTSEDRQTVDKSVTVNVSGVGIISFTATPATVMRGEPVTLAYMLAGRATSTKITDEAGTEIFTGGADLTATTMVTPEATTTYTLTVMSAAGNPTATAMVTVSAVLPTIDSFSASPAITGEPVSVAWRTTNAEQIQISVDGVIRKPWTTAGAAMGFSNFTVTNEITNFKLEAKNQDGMVERDLVVTAMRRPEIPVFTLTPASYSGASTPATLTYETMYATTVDLKINNQPVANFPSDQLSGTFNFSVSGGAASITLTAHNPASDNSMTGMIVEGFIDAEPNDTTDVAIPVPGDGTQVRGSLGPDDLDMYSVEVPEGARIYASAGVNSNGQCTADTAIRLIGPDGITTLGLVDEVTYPLVDHCAVLNPASAAFADVLPNGTYYVVVEPGITHTSTETYSLTIRVSGPNEPNLGATYMVMGTPAWQFADCLLFKAEVGMNATSNLELQMLMQDVMRPLHHFDFNTFEMLNETPHTRPYDTELQAMVGAQGFTPQASFSAAEVAPPNGIVTLCMLTPNAAAPVGTTFDGDMLPMILHTNTLHNEASFDLNGAPLGGFSVDLPSYVDLGLIPPGDGLSHRIMFNFVSEGLIEQTGNYVLRYTINDLDGNIIQMEQSFDIH